MTKLVKVIDCNTFACAAPINCVCLICCRRYGTKCSGCAQGISPQDMVRKARDKVFHLTCFTCTMCRKQLSTGEELYVLDDSKFICKDDYLQAKHGNNTKLTYIFHKSSCFTNENSSVPCYHHFITIKKHSKSCPFPVDINAWKIYKYVLAYINGSNIAAYGILVLIPSYSKSLLPSWVKKKLMISNNQLE